MNKAMIELLERIRYRMTPYSKTMGGDKIDNIFQMEEQTNDLLIETLRELIMEGNNE